MKVNSFIRILAVNALFLVPSAQAALLASDDFNSYGAGLDLSGENGGTGWSSNWTAESGNVTSQTGVIPGSDVSMRITDNGSSDGIAKRSFASQNGTVYVGFQIRTSDLYSNEFFQIYLNDGVGDNTKGGSVGIRNELGNPAFARVAGSGTTTNLTGSDIDDTNVHQVVLKLSKTGTGHATNYDFAEVFLDLATEDTGAAITNYGSQLGDSTVSSLNTVAFRTHQFDLNSDIVYIDNLRLATTYADAIVIPEASSYVLLGLSIFAFIIFGYRKK